MPHRRSMASALQILLSHAFGDASGPWIVGAISDWVNLFNILNKFKKKKIRGSDERPEARFHSLRAAFYLPNVLLFLSGIAFLGAAFSLPHSMRQMEEWKNSRIPQQNANPNAGIITVLPLIPFPFDSHSNWLHPIQSSKTVSFQWEHQ